MTNTLFNMYNRQQALKTWKPIPNIHLQPKEIQYYDHKIKMLEETDYGSLKYPGSLIDIEAEQPQIDANYLRHVVLKYMRNLIEYIENKGVILEDVEWNIKLIINEILTNQVNEDYYLNTIDIYESINPSIVDPDIYYLIDQAIRLDNKKMLYYLIFKKNEEMADRLSEIIRE